MTEEEKKYESDAEDYEDYGPNGYHPVYLGEKFKDGRYKVVQKLGWGHFSTVWMAFDNQTQRNVALKIQKSKESYSEAAIDEIDLLKTLNVSKDNPEWARTRKYLEKKGFALGKDDIYSIEIIDNFVHFGMHGKHYCSTFDIMGPNLLDIMMYFDDNYQAGLPVAIVKQITRQLLIALDYMHRISNLIHTDLKPENIMIELPKEKRAEFEQQIAQVGRLPLSMKYLEEIKKSKKGKKRKKRKKRKKKKPAAEDQDGGQKAPDDVGKGSVVTGTSEGVSHGVSMEDELTEEEASNLIPILKKKVVVEEPGAMKKKEEAALGAGDSGVIADAGEGAEKTDEGPIVVEKESAGNVVAEEEKIAEGTLIEVAEANELVKVEEGMAIEEKVEEVAGEVEGETNEPQNQDTVAGEGGDGAPGEQAEEKIEDKEKLEQTAASNQVGDTQEEGSNQVDEPTTAKDEAEHGTQPVVEGGQGTKNDLEMEVENLEEQANNQPETNPENDQEAINEAETDLNQTEDQAAAQEQAPEPETQESQNEGNEDPKEEKAREEIIEAENQDPEDDQNPSEKENKASNSTGLFASSSKGLFDDIVVKDKESGIFEGLSTSLNKPSIKDPQEKEASKAPTVSTSAGLFSTSETKMEQEPLPKDNKDRKEHENNQPEPQKIQNEEVQENLKNEPESHNEDDYEEEEQSEDGSEEEDDDADEDPYQGKTEFVFYWKDCVKIDINPKIQIKVVDFGNACWTHKHFTSLIQTREYRSPEAIIGANYEANTDMWSLACIVFELLTGDFLFKPTNDKDRPDEPKDEIHLALMIATLGPIPKKISHSGKFSRDMFNKNGRLKHCKVPESYSISQILNEEYDFSEKEAEEIEDFLMPMLEYDVKKRISAQDALELSWINSGNGGSGD